MSCSSFNMHGVKPRYVVCGQAIRGVLTTLCGLRFSGMSKPPRNDDVKRQVGLRLRAIREVMRLDQKTFARELGVETSALGNWERGDRLADVLAMTRLYHRWGFTLEWVYAGSLRGLDYDTAHQLEQAAIALGAVVGGPVVEWPMATENRPGESALRPPARVPKSRVLNQAKGFHDG